MVCKTFLKRILFTSYAQLPQLEYRVERAAASMKYNRVMDFIASYDPVSMAVALVGIIKNKERDCVFKVMRIDIFLDHQVVACMS